MGNRSYSRWRRRMLARGKDLNKQVYKTTREKGGDGAFFASDLTVDIQRNYITEKPVHIIPYPFDPAKRR